ncbi:MAG: hypothetical protein EBS06_09345, partial [Proteobacteria bacterium]|nr:hypothetical protein [Pseudomonadota bacterium]
SEFNIKGEIKKGRVGIWVTDKNGAEKKIAAIGIEFGVTSIAEILGQVDEKKFDKIVQQKFEKLVGRLV